MITNSTIAGHSMIRKLELSKNQGKYDQLKGGVIETLSVKEKYIKIFNIYNSHGVP
jgi:hypothetical protein